MGSTRYIQPKEAARKLNYPLASFYRLIRDKRMPGVVRLGPKSIRIDAEKLQKWIDNGGIQQQKDVEAPQLGKHEPGDGLRVAGEENVVGETLQAEADYLCSIPAQIDAGELSLASPNTKPGKKS
jgi:excisionase family DNA binding protein